MSPPSSPSTPPHNLKQRVSTDLFGEMPDGTPISVYTLRNAGGMEVRAIDYGGIIVSARVPDRSGVLANVTLGFDSLGEYLTDSPFFGALIGRYGNRIANGRFTVDGTSYVLERNDGPNHLHGGSRGFDKVVWTGTPFAGDGESGVVLTYTSPAGEAGYPGTLEVAVTYTLTDDDVLDVRYHAVTDVTTPVNLTQHTYFNLAGAGHVLDHELEIAARHFTPIDATQIPTGEICTVTGTPFDFTTRTPIGLRIDEDDEQLARGAGYDHNFVLEGPTGTMKLAGRAYEPRSGRLLEVRTTEPGVQFYSGNMIPEGLAGPDGIEYGPRTGFCLETQHYPDSPNQPNFPSTFLEPDEAYASRTTFRFTTRD